MENARKRKKVGEKEVFQEKLFTLQRSTREEYKQDNDAETEKISTDKGVKKSNQIRNSCFLHLCLLIVRYVRRYVFTTS